MIYEVAVTVINRGVFGYEGRISSISPILKERTHEFTTTSVCREQVVEDLHRRIDDPVPCPGPNSYFTLYATGNVSRVNRFQSLMKYYFVEAENGCPEKLGTDIIFKMDSHSDYFSQNPRRTNWTYSRYGHKHNLLDLVTM